MLNMHRSADEETQAAGAGDELEQRRFPAVQDVRRRRASNSEPSATDTATVNAAPNRMSATSRIYLMGEPRATQQK